MATRAKKKKVPYATQLFFVGNAGRRSLDAPEVKLGVSGGRADAFTVLINV